MMKSKGLLNGMTGGILILFCFLCCGNLRAERGVQQEVDVSAVTGADHSAYVVNTTLYVSVSTGSDSAGTGAQDAPFATFGKALATAIPLLVAGDGVKISLGAGLYREGEYELDATALGGAAKQAPLIIEGSTSGLTLLSGGESLPSSGWIYNENKNVYQCAWNGDFGDGYVRPYTSARLNGVNAAAPRGVTLSPGFLGKKGAPDCLISVKWLAPENPEDLKEYRVQRRLNGGVWTTIRTISPSEPLKFDDQSASFTKLGIYNQYEYRVEAVYPSRSEPSNSFFTMNAKPGVGYAEPGTGFYMDPIGRRSELLFVDGKAMQQVMSLADLADGMFWVDDGYMGVADGTMTLRVAGGVAGKNIEAAVRRYFLQLLNKNNVAFRNLVFEHFANPGGHIGNMTYNTGVVCMEGGSSQEDKFSNLTVSNCVFRWNNGVGLEISSGERVTLADNTAEGNGMNGLKTKQINNFLVDGLNLRENCWRAKMGHQKLFHVAACKNTFIYESIWRNVLAVSNDLTGLWFDLGNEDILIENSTFIDCDESGLFLEASGGPFKVTGCEATGNDVGIKLHLTPNIRVENCRVYDNKRGQFEITDASRLNIRNWRHGGTYPPLVSTNHSLIANQVFISKPWPGGGDKDSFYRQAGNAKKGQAPNYPEWINSLESDYNIFCNRESDLQHFWNGTEYIDFEAWQKFSGQDIHSELRNQPPEPGYLPVPGL